MENVFALLISWCEQFITPDTDIEEVSLIVEEQLREYDLHHSRHNLPALTDDQWEGLQDGLITYFHDLSRDSVTV